MIKIEWDPVKLAEAKKNHWEWVKNRLENNSFKSGEKYVAFVKRILNITSDKDLETLITGSYDEVMALNIKYDFRKNPFKKKNGESDDDFKKRNEPYTKALSERDCIITALGYDAMNGGKEWNFYKFCEMLNVDVCPYCNRQYVFAIEKKVQRKLKRKIAFEDKHVSRPEIDHFIPKSIYPQYSCSLFNFVPSCSVCNHIKSNKDVFATVPGTQVNSQKLEIVYPYKEGFDDDGVFALKYGKDILSEKAKLIDPANNCVFVDVKQGTTSSAQDKEARIKGSLSLFFIEDFYNKHKNDLEDLLTRYEHYSKPMIDDIASLFSAAEWESLFPDIKDEDEKIRVIKRLAEYKIASLRNEILGLPLGSENRQYPLKKFKMDIIKQLDDMYMTQKSGK